MSLKPLLLTTLIAIILSFVTRPMIVNTELGEITIILSLFILFIALPITLLIYLLRAKDFVDAWVEKHPRAQIALGTGFVVAVIGFGLYGLFTNVQSPNLAKLATAFWEDMKIFLILVVYMVTGMLIITTIQTALKKFPKTDIIVSVILLIAYLTGFVYFALPLFTDFLQINGKWLLYTIGGLAVLVAIVGMILFLSRKMPNKLKENITNSLDTVIAFVKAKKDKVCPPIEAPDTFQQKTQK